MPEDIVEPVIPPEPEVPPPMSEEERNGILMSTEDVLKDLSPLIREEDINQARQLAKECELNTVVNYLVENIPYLKERLGKSPMKYSAGQDSAGEGGVTVEEIKRILRERAESMVPDYNMPPPFLGNEIDEARSKQEDAETRYATQYEQVPFVKPVYRGRSAIDNPYYGTPDKKKVYRSPKVTRIKFI